MTGRNIYLVGSVPMASAEEVFKAVSAALGPRIKRIPDGETGERGDWITWLEPAFADESGVGEVRRILPRACHRHRPRALPAQGRRRKPQDVHFDNLFYADIASESFAAFKRLKDEGEIAPGTKFQIDLVPAHSVHLALSRG